MFDPDEIDYYDQDSCIRIVEVVKDVKLATCNRCGHSWEPKSVMPRTCGNQKCRSPYWNKERRVKIGGKWGFDKWELNKWYLLPKFVKPDGFPDTARNETRWRSLAQFARRRGWVAQFNAHNGPMYARLVKL